MCELHVYLYTRNTSLRNWTHDFVGLDGSVTRTPRYTLAPPPLPRDASPWLPMARADSPSIDTDLSQSSAAGSAAHAHDGLRRSCPWPWCLRAAYRAACKVDTPSAPHRAGGRLQLSPLVSGRVVHRYERCRAHRHAVSTLIPCWSCLQHRPDDVFRHESEVSSGRREGHGRARPSRR